MLRQIGGQAKKILIGLIGGLVVIIGLVLVPYPGPGWLVVFAGLAILATEFDCAQRLLRYARRRYDQWATWFKARPLIVKLLSLALTGAIVTVTLWLLNTFGMIAALFGLPYDLLYSPFVRH